MSAKAIEPLSDSGETDEDRRYWAKCASHPTWHAANSVARLSAGEKGPYIIQELLDELGKQVHAVTRKSDISRCHAMLTGQAHTLQSLHYHLLEMAMERFIDREDIDLFLRYSLRAQAQCRQTIETQANLRNPRTLAYMQTNIAENIQVNNTPTALEVFSNAQSKLLATQDDNMLDRGATGETGGGNSSVEAVGAVDGSKISGG
jgi:hypothetical protein